MRRSRHSEDSRLFFDWLEIAARDLQAARLLAGQDQCLEIAGFHCQQCMEKAFKAYLIRHTGQLVDGHNLSWLCRQAVKIRNDFARWRDPLAEMNRLYIETRYPSDHELDLTPESLEQIIHITDEIYTLICDDIYGEDPAVED